MQRFLKTQFLKHKGHSNSTMAFDSFNLNFLDLELHADARPIVAACIIELLFTGEAKARAASFV